MTEQQLTLLYPVWHRMLYSCTHMATVGVKGLNWSTVFSSWQLVLYAVNCVGELQECLSKLVKDEIDVASMRITLDVICLTLPLPDDTGRHSATSASDVTHTMSVSSQLSFPGADSDLTPEVVTPSKTVTAISE